MSFLSQLFLTGRSERVYRGADATTPQQAERRRTTLNPALACTIARNDPDAGLDSKIFQ